MKYIREKGKWGSGEKKFVIEENGKYLKTVPRAEELFSLLCLEKLSYSIKEEKSKIEKKASETSFNQILNECPKQDGKGILIPFAEEESNKDSVIWKCDRCGFSTGLIFEDKKCPKCKPNLLPDRKEFEEMARKKKELEKKR